MPLAAAAGGGLDHDGEPDLAGDALRVGDAVHGADVARHGRDADRRRQLLGGQLVAHGLDGVRVGTDERHAGLGQRAGEGGVLRQEAVAWVHGIGAGLAAGGHDPLDREVGLRRRGRADGDGLVGARDVQRVAVGLGMDGDGGDAHAPRRLHDPAGDLAAIGHKDLVEHARPIRRRCLGGRRGENKRGVRRDLLPIVVLRKSEPFAREHAMHPVVLEKKSQIEFACRRNSVARLDIFGSAARAPDFEPGRSDVDFLVEFGTCGKEDTFLALKEALEQILECRVDLVDRRALETSRNCIRRAHVLADIEVVFRQSIVDALSMPGLADIEFDPKVHAPAPRISRDVAVSSSVNAADEALTLGQACLTAPATAAF